MIIIGYCARQEGAEASVQDRRISGPDHQVVQRRKRNQDQKRYISFSSTLPFREMAYPLFYRLTRFIIWLIRLDLGRIFARPCSGVGATTLSMTSLIIKALSRLDYILTK